VSGRTLIRAASQLAYDNDIIIHVALKSYSPPHADFLEQLWCFCNTLTISKESPTAERIAWFATQNIQRIGGLAMSIAGLKSTEQTTATKTVFAANDVRALIANHLGVSVDRVTDEAHLTDDLGADWLDSLDLMMAVEDQFAGVEITDDDVDRI